MPFSILCKDPCSGARTGMLTLAHGLVETPCFMPVGTHATVKAMRTRDLEQIGVGLILANAYHLFLRPGREVIEKAGGLHCFMGWPHNILTDSGGFQIFSLAPLCKIEDEGVHFRSHVDGSAHHLSPEDVVEFETVLGSDVLMPLDVCTAPGIPRIEAEEAARRTTEWLARSKRKWMASAVAGKNELFGIMQGNFYRDLRAASAKGIVDLDLPGYAIGGLSVGEEFKVFQEFLHYSAGLLPIEKPRYLMGIGTPEYILEAVEAGIDLFDCVFPTRTARNALVFTRDGPLSIRNEGNRLDFRPIDEDCLCDTCQNHSRSYLRHLFKSREILAAMLATVHNLAFIQALVQGIRASILRGSFPSYKREFLARYTAG